MMLSKVESRKEKLCCSVMKLHFLESGVICMCTLNRASMGNFNFVLKNQI